MKHNNSRDVPKTVDADHTDGPIMLALSTFRRSERAVNLAIDRAKPCRSIALVNVVDVNLARYFIGLDIALYPELKKQAEEELLEVHKQQGRQRMSAIAERAEANGLKVKTYVRTGRFALVCLEIIEEVKPSLIITTRSRRPAWVKKLFGSPVDYLITHTSCPVIEA